MTTTTETATGVSGHTGSEDDPDATLHAYFAAYGCGPKETTTRTEARAVGGMPKTDVVVQLTGTDGNVFSLAGAVAAALKRAGHYTEADAMYAELRQCQSYDEALQLFMRYVEVE